MKVKVLLASMLILTSMSLYADPVCNYFPGGVTCGSGTVSSVIAYGVATLNGTTVTQILNINGTVTSTNATINRFTIDGKTQFQGGSVSIDSIIKGLLNATGTHFSDLDIYSNETYFNDSITGNLGVTCDQVGCEVYLRSGTSVHGDINFKASPGIVYVSGGSSVSGKVINGRIVPQ